MWTVSHGGRRYYINLFHFHSGPRHSQVCFRLGRPFYGGENRVKEFCPSVGCVCVTQDTVEDGAFVPPVSEKLGCKEVRVFM